MGFTIGVGAARQQHDRANLRMTAAGLHRLVHTAAAAYHAKRPAVDRALRGQELQRGVDVAWHPLDHALARGAEVGERSRRLPPKPRKSNASTLYPACSASSQAGRRCGDRRCTGAAGGCLGRPSALSGRCPRARIRRRQSSARRAAPREVTVATRRVCDREAESRRPKGPHPTSHRSMSTSFTSASRSTRKPMFGVPISSQLWPP